MAKFDPDFWRKTAGVDDGSGDYKPPPKPKGRTYVGFGRLSDSMQQAPGPPAPWSGLRTSQPDLFFIGAYTVSYNYRRGVWTIRRAGEEVGTAKSAADARRIVYSLAQQR